MSIYNALYGRDGHGVGPNEPEKKGFARFCQMVGRDLGHVFFPVNQLIHRCF